MKLPVSHDDKSSAAIVAKPEPNSVTPTSNWVRIATNTVAVFKPAWPLPSRSAAGVELTAALLAKTRDRVLEQFPGSRFVVVMYPVNYTLAYEEQCRRAFTGKGLDTLAFPEPLLETVPPDRRFAEGNFGHPSAESNRVFAAWLARELSPMPEAAR